LPPKYALLHKCNWSAAAVTSLNQALIQQEIRDAESARQTIAALLALLQGTPFRRPPPEPTMCCGRGCSVCVWEGFVTASETWRLDVLHLLKL
jgi:hypothetical protein